MIHAFHFENGKVSYKNRWVQTSKWKQERKAGRSLVNLLNPMDPDPEWNPEGEDGTANTNIVFHGDKLLALEEGHPPFEIDPITLESIGTYNYEGKLLSPMTAHPLSSKRATSGSALRLHSRWRRFSPVLSSFFTPGPSFRSLSIGARFRASGHVQ